MFLDQIQIVKQDIFAYLLVDPKTSEILDGNLLAKSYYMMEDSFPPINRLFSPNADKNKISDIIKQLDCEGATVLDRVFSTTVNEETFPCHIEISKISDNLLFLVIKEKDTMDGRRIEELVNIEDNPIFVLENDENLTVHYGNQRYNHFLKLDNKENPSSFLTLLSPDRRTVFFDFVKEQLEHHEECNVDIELTTDGEYFQLFRFSAFQSRLDRKIYGVLITAKKQSDLMKKIEYDQQYFDIMQQFSKDLLFRVDMKRSTLVHRGDISKLNGLLPEMEHFPECIREIDLVHPEDLEGYLAFAYAMMSGEQSSFEPRFKFQNGSYEKYRLQGSPLFNAEGNVIQVVGKCENIQKYVDIEAKANYDALTAALNKQSFRELIEDNLHRAVAQDKFALLFLDLDDFKHVNDTYGHIFGDFLLEATCKRILNCIRKQDRLGRVGGDEFVIFFQFAPCHESVQERAEAILHSLRREFNFNNETCKVKSSIGISLFPEHGRTYDELYEMADKALYISKEKGKDVATIYNGD